MSEHDKKKTHHHFNKLLTAFDLSEAYHIPTLLSLSLKIRDYGTLYIAIRIRVYWLLLIRILMNNLLTTQQKGTPCFAAKHLVSCYDTPCQSTQVLAGIITGSQVRRHLFGDRIFGGEDTTLSHTEARTINLMGDSEILLFPFHTFRGRRWFSGRDVDRTCLFLTDC